MLLFQLYFPFVFRYKLYNLAPIVNISNLKYGTIVSTQLKASPFERAYKCALNRVLLINLVLNLTLACNQCNFVSAHVILHETYMLSVQYL